MKKLTYKSIELGRLYEIAWLDHYSTESNSSQNATPREPVILKSYGVYIGKNKNYIILAQNYENETSENNDNIHIIKREIQSIRELK